MYRIHEKGEVTCTCVEQSNQWPEEKDLGGQLWQHMSILEECLQDKIL